MIYAMTVTMDKSGRLVIPKEIRREAALEPGTPLDIKVREGRIEIEPQAARVTFRRKGSLLVAHLDGKVPPMTKETVDRVLQKVRRREL